MNKDYLEPNSISDDDVVVRVITEKGAVCMDEAKYDDYIKNKDKNSNTDKNFSKNKAL